MIHHDCFSCRKFLIDECEGKDNAFSVDGCWESLENMIKTKKTMTNTEINRKCAELMGRCWHMEPTGNKSASMICSVCFKKLYEAHKYNFSPTTSKSDWYDFFVWCMKQGIEEGSWWRTFLSQANGDMWKGWGEVLPLGLLHPLEALPRAVVTFVEEEK